MDPFRREVEEHDGTKPDTWKPEKGDMLIGTLVRYDGPIETQYGPGHIAVIMDEDSGKEWSVWLLETVLLNEWTALAPDPGERVAIKFAGVVEGGDRPYKNYIVRVDRKGANTKNPFRHQPASDPPAPDRSTSPPPPSPRAPSPPDQHDEAADKLYGRQFDPGSFRPLDPGAELKRLQDVWNKRISNYRVESWGPKALAMAHPKLLPDPDRWKESDLRIALELFEAHGPTVFVYSATELAKDDPAPESRLTFALELLEEAGPKDKLRAQEAIDTGWDGAVEWAIEFLTPEQESGGGSDPELDQPKDNLPF